MRSEVAGAAAPRAATFRDKRRTRLVVLIVLAVVLVYFAVYLLSHAGSFLIVHAPEHADVIVVLDDEWQKAVELQRKGYAPKILLDAAVNSWLYGRNEAELAREWVQTQKFGSMEVCPVIASSTYAEVASVQQCLAPLHVHSVLLVVSNFDTRRALEIFRARLPHYQWSVAASSAPFHFADQYWKHRAWAKTVLNAWEQYLWWKVVDERRSDLVLAQSPSK
jgi:uncharacterized SAM-binding protein YcdF (DUF218 family)